MKTINVLLLLLVAAAPCSAQKQNKAGDFVVEPYVFESSSGQKVDAEMGHLFVPENRNRPDGRVIELAFVRFRSTSATPGPPIVYLAGGPGGSGISAARGSRFPLFMAMREVADVIAIDQRGTGLSKPNLACPQTLDAPLDRPGDPTDLLRRYRARSRECADSWRTQGVDLTAYNTNESAHDLESLRMALGVPKISLWSISYGTHLALAFIRLHDASLDRAILAGIEGPAHTYKRPANIDLVLREDARRANADPEVRKRIPDLMKAIRALDADLAREPFVVEVEDPKTKLKVGVAIGSHDLRLLVGGIAGGNPELLPTLVYHLARRDVSNPTVQFAATYLFAERTGSIGSAMSFMMDCASGSDPERLRQIRLEASRTFLGTTMDFPFPDVCDAWGSLDLGAGFRSPVRSKVPVLFISGTLDARTPPTNAEEVMRGFPHGVHLVIDGAAHSDPLFLSSPLIKDRMLAFMKGQSLPTTRLTVPLVFVPVE